MKKIGNIFLILFFWSSAFLRGQQSIEVQLAVKTAQGLPLHEVSVDTLFLLNVTILHHTGTLHTDKFFIEAPDSFKLFKQGTTAKISTINGVSEKQTILQYAVRPSELGTFTLGPASATIDGNVYTSNNVRVTVVQEAAERTTRTQPWLELVIPEGPLVVGQTIPISIRFYYLNMAECKTVTPPRINGFSISTFEGPTKNATEIDGALYDYLEWRGTMVAKEPGTFTFEPAHAEYVMQTRDRSTNIFSFLSDRFAFGMQQYETHSNKPQLTVNPLPTSSAPVLGVGVFSSVVAKVNQTSAKQSEGIIYTLEITGDMAVKELAHPTLTVPDTLTAYESKKSVLPQRTNSKEYRKAFEYVMQAKKSGAITIPAQTFTFYNPYEQRFTSLSTEPITLTIEPNVSISPKKESKQQESQTQNEDTAHIEKPPFPLAREGIGFGLMGLPALVFWAILGLLCAGLIVQWSRFMWQWYTVRNHEYLRARAAFTRAQKRLVAARRERNAKELHALFLQLYADRHGRHTGQVLESDLFEWLSRAQLPPETVKQFGDFLRQVQEYVFYDTAQIPPASLFVDAEKWLALLEKTTA